MSRATKIYILIISLALILFFGSGISSTQGLKIKTNQHSKWLATISSCFDVRLKEVTAEELTTRDNQEGKNTESLDSMPEVEVPPAVKGIYYSGWMTGNSTAFKQLLAFVKTTEVNSVVIDVKDDRGIISYPSQVGLAAEVGSGQSKYNPIKVIDALRRNNIYPIARVVVFKDPFLASHRPDLAVKNSEGGLWQDYKGLNWVDPYNRAVWDYNIDIAKEACRYGFKEIQFDYIRFTSDGEVKDCRYPGVDGRLKADVIRDFLKYAYQELKPLGVRVSADVFGLTCSAQGDIGIGQVMEKVVEGVDIVSPMVYPSHYVNGSYNIANPDLKPYETIYRSLMDAQKKLAVLTDKTGFTRKVIIRPWLQDFSIKSHYGREQLLAQIKAVESAGLKEWIFWNPVNHYDYHKYRLKNEVPVEMPLPADNFGSTSELPFPNSGLNQGLINLPQSL